jgi:hypothetical protein
MSAASSSNLGIASVTVRQEFARILFRTTFQFPKKVCFAVYMLSVPHTLKESW